MSIFRFVAKMVECPSIIQFWTQNSDESENEFSGSDDNESYIPLAKISRSITFEIGPRL